MGALQEKLMDQRLVKVFCEEYTRHSNELRKKQNSARAGFEAELQKLERKRKRCVDAIMEGLPAHQFKDELRRIDERRIEVEGLLANSEEVPVVLHPAMAKYYQQQVSQLAQAVTDPALRGEANDILRSLVEKIVLTPNKERTALVIDLYGGLAGILSISEAGEKHHHLPRQSRLKAVSAARADGGRYMHNSIVR